MSNPDPRDITILPRPQISVFLNGLGEIGITVTGVSEDNERVEVNEISIPFESAEEVAKALMSFVGK